MRMTRTRFLALGSPDCDEPRGSAQDNTHCLKFMAACKRIHANPSLLDLGCAGGGLVKDFADDGLIAVGVDGSDANIDRPNSEWNDSRELFFLADIAQPFTVHKDDNSAIPFQFDFVSAWEVLEHIHEKDLPTLFLNIGRHLKSGGFFVGSVSTIHDKVGGIEYHQTIKGMDWWWSMFELYGLKVIDWHDYFRRDEFPRGSGNPHAVGDWSGNEGFHIMATK